MLNPGRSLIIWLAVLAAGTLLFLLSFHSSQPFGNDWPAVAVAVIGIMMVPFGVGYGIWALLLFRGEVRLRRGYGELGQWNVPADEWREFVEFDRVRAETDLYLSNDYPAEKFASDDGVEVIAGETGIIIGRYYQTLRRGGLPALQAVYWLSEPADPQCLEFHIIYPRKAGPGVRLCLRAPVPQAALEAGARVFEHFGVKLRPGEPVALRNPRASIAVSLGLALICAIAAAWGFANQDPSTEGGVIALVAGMIGAIVAFTALIFAVAIHFMSRRAGQK